MRAQLLFAVLATTSPAADTSFVSLAMQLRQEQLLRIGGRPVMSPAPAPRRSMFSSRFSWHLQIGTSVFWAGESAASGGGVSNYKSAFDSQWVLHAPAQGQFYFALPYVDTEGGHTKTEASSVIPWFKDAYVKDGQTVLEGKWVAIRHGNRVCYAQWRDVGPFCTDHWQYVFGSERPRPNRNRDAGLDVSPAVRDYLGLNGLDVCDWKFCERPSPGPWLIHGNNGVLALKK